ncbi:hypothetical protein BJF93_05690 [Xaviernesmea oryzae]|uniref:Uncharacterized protein n=1 Tax=Xaviernesmea oryzae TaxID=464029 RepID=A0A1Q9ARR5_9HYPH|nr:hypothetical protein [Xaviernesmea oryzae]OLP58124.1 hypothetical protein BJF93_05690 [Xaviernesmea oryzae]SEL82032.1 hypothetical protein SAMN04487976_11364 [Xaviernesmea oryzae]
MTTGEEIFWQNARRILWDMQMLRLDPAHGAAVDIVRWCLLIRGRPTHHRQAFLERESPALLAYLEKLASCGEPQGWRTLEERVRFRLRVLREYDMQPCARPWLAAIWHTLPEMAALGQAILDRKSEIQDLAPDVALLASDAATGTGGDGDKGSAGKAGSATSNKPHSPRRLEFPPVPVVATEAEKKALDLEDVSEITNTKTDVVPDGPDTGNGTAGPKPPGGKP